MAWEADSAVEIGFTLSSEEQEEGPGGTRLEFVHLLPVRPEPM
jgi:hypothetical protein